MAEVVGLAASVLQIGGAGAKLSIELYNFISTASRADSDITHIAVDVDTTSKVLGNVGKVLEEDESRKLVNQDAVQHAKDLIKQCEQVFNELSDVVEKARKTGKDGRSRVSFRAKMSWPMIGQRVELLRRRLETLKSSLLVLFHVLQLAHDKARGDVEFIHLEEQKKNIRELHQQQQDSLRILRALEMKLCTDGSKVDNSTLSHATTMSVPSGQPAITMQTAPPCNAANNQTERNNLAMATFKNLEPDTSDTDAHTSSDEGEHLTTHELAECAIHVQKLLRRIMALQDSLKAGQPGDHHRKRRLHKVYQRFCRKMEKNLLKSPDVVPPGEVRAADEVESDCGHKIEEKLDRQQPRCWSRPRQGLSHVDTMPDRLICGVGPPQLNTIQGVDNQGHRASPARRGSSSSPLRDYRIRSKSPDDYLQSLVARTESRASRRNSIRESEGAPVRARQKLNTLTVSQHPSEVSDKAVDDHGHDTSISTTHPHVAGSDAADLSRRVPIRSWSSSSRLLESTSVDDSLPTEDDGSSLSAQERHTFHSRQQGLPPPLHAELQHAVRPKDPRVPGTPPNPYLDYPQHSPAYTAAVGLSGSLSFLGEEDEVEIETQVDRTEETLDSSSKSGNLQPNSRQDEDVDMPDARIGELEVAKANDAIAEEAIRLRAADEALAKLGSRAVYTETSSSAHAGPDGSDASTRTKRSNSEPSPLQRRKSVVDKAKHLGQAVGLAGIAVRPRSRSRSSYRHPDERDFEDNHRFHNRRSSSPRSRSRSRGLHDPDKWEQAAKAALVCGAVEAFRSRNVPGAWTGSPGQRVATAALAAAGIDSLIDREANDQENRRLAVSGIAGSLANRAVGSSRSRSRVRRDRSPDRFRSRSSSLFASSPSEDLQPHSRGRSRYRQGIPINEEDKKPEASNDSTSSSTTPFGGQTDSDRFGPWADAMSLDVPSPGDDTQNRTLQDISAEPNISGIITSNAKRGSPRRSERPARTYSPYDPAAGPRASSSAIPSIVLAHGQAQWQALAEERERPKRRDHDERRSRDDHFDVPERREDRRSRSPEQRYEPKHRNEQDDAKRDSSHLLSSILAGTCGQTPRYRRERKRAGGYEGTQGRAARRQRRAEHHADGAIASSSLFDPTAPLRERRCQTPGPVDIVDVLLERWTEPVDGASSSSAQKTVDHDRAHNNTGTSPAVRDERVRAETQGT